MKDTVIFDMDGTVLNTLTDLTESVNYVMTEFGFPTHGEETYRQAFGNGIRHALEVTVPEGTEEDIIHRMLPVFKEHYDAHCLDQTGPYEGILSLMEALKAKGNRMAIVSNKIDSAVKELNDRFFSKYVDVAIGERPGINRKPAPDTVMEALKELERTPEDAVYIGDSEVDLATARNAGMPCIAVLWGFRDAEFLRASGGSVFAKAPEDVLPLLESLK